MKSPIQVVLFEVTRSCNLNCKHSYASAPQKKQGIISKNLTLEQIKQVFKKIEPHHIKNLALTGGEPFLRNDLFEIVDQAGMNGFESIIINTNGVLLNEGSTLEHVKDRTDLITSIMISLDGATRSTHDFIRGSGQFDNLMVIFEKISKENIPFGLNVTLGNWNFHEIEKFFAIHEKYNASYINFGIFFPLGNGASIKDEVLNPKDYSKLIKITSEKKKTGINVDLCSVPYSRIVNDDISGYCCNIFTDFITITSEGNVIPCLFYEINCGNLLSMDLNEILENPMAKTLRDPAKLRAKMKGRCKNCEEFETCRGGCNLLTFLLKNDFFESDPLCPIEYFDDF